jgi:hypothetical protein
LEQYRGGLHCCTSGNILLDKAQNPWADGKHQLEYYMKWRFWFQNYTAAPHSSNGNSNTAAAAAAAAGKATQALEAGEAQGQPQEEAKAGPQASHQNLVRFFKETEADAGEYDVVKAAPGTAPEDTIYQIQAQFQTKSGVAPCNPRTSPHCAGAGVKESGITLVYASGHCHAPSCIKMELWNLDTGELICRQEPVYGTNPHTGTPGNATYDEVGYIAVPPCLYGPESEGLMKPIFLAYDQNLSSIKWNNNTYDHYGEMAMWQMRGYQSYEPTAK